MFVSFITRRIVEGRSLSSLEKAREAFEPKRAPGFIQLVSLSHSYHDTERKQTYESEEENAVLHLTWDKYL